MEQNVHGVLHAGEILFHKNFICAFQSSFKTA